MKLCTATSTRTYIGCWKRSITVTIVCTIFARSEPTLATSKLVLHLTLDDHPAIAHAAGFWRFHNRVACYPFDDHNPAPLELVADCCADMQRWLDKHPDNCAVIHCKAGKGEQRLKTRGSNQRC